MKSYQKVLQKSKGVARALPVRGVFASEQEVHWKWTSCSLPVQGVQNRKSNLLKTSRLMSLTLNTSALQYWPVVRAPPDGTWKCHVFTLLPLLLRDWSPLALTYMHETLYVHRTWDVQKSLLDPNPKPNRKTAILHFMWNRKRFFAIFMQCILTNSSYTVDPIPTKLGEPVLKASTIKKYRKLLHKLKGVASPAPWPRMNFNLRHKTRNCSSVYIVWYDQNCSHFMSPALNTSALQYWLAVRAPSTGNR